MKRTAVYGGITVGLSTLLVFGFFITNSNSNSLILNKATSPKTYKHYNAIAPTPTQHGCREFWVLCSDYSYTFTAPTDGTIVEGGDITDNPSFDWNGMDVLDERFIPSTNQQKSWGMVPVLDQGNNKVTYGLFPQTYVSDADTIAALNALTDESIYDTNGYYYYNGNFYQNCIGDKCDNDSHFADGTKVVNGTKYWFICKPISWVIMSKSGSTYQLYSEKLIHAGIAWGYNTSNVYEQSQVREWLNGIGTYADNGFLQTALYPNQSYLQTMSLTLDDGSTLLNDRVRLFKKDEANDATYFANDNARKAIITDWAAAHHACCQSGTSSYGRWWLCEANTDNTSNAWGVGLGGAVGNGGPKTGSGSDDRCERPVITITLEQE